MPWFITVTVAGVNDYLGGRGSETLDLGGLAEITAPGKLITAPGKLKAAAARVGGSRRLPGCPGSGPDRAEPGAAYSNPASVPLPEVNRAGYGDAIRYNPSLETAHPLPASTKSMSSNLASASIFVHVAPPSGVSYSVPLVANAHP